MLRRLVGVLIALLVSLLTAPLPSEAAGPAMLTAIYAHDGHQASISWTDTATERGPPADAFADIATFDIADHRSSGAVTRLDEVRHETTTGCTASADLEPDGSVVTMFPARVRRADAMAISIELWTSEGLVGGAEHWWDDIEANLNAMDPMHEALPLLSQVDPYGDATFSQSELEPLSEELERLPGAVTTRDAEGRELDRLD